MEHMDGQLKNTIRNPEVKGAYVTNFNVLTCNHIFPAHCETRTAICIKLHSNSTTILPIDFKMSQAHPFIQARNQ